MPPPDFGLIHSFKFTARAHVVLERAHLPWIQFCSRLAGVTFEVDARQLTCIEIIMQRAKLTSAEITKLAALPGNEQCVECGASAPKWASVSVGALICVGCAGLHRHCGVHLTFVRSLDMDLFEPQQVRRLKSGGNQKWDAYCASHGLVSAGMRRYDTPHAEHYRAVIAALGARCRPPAWPATLAQQWVDPHAGETSKETAAREAREASARVAQRLAAASSSVPQLRK